MKKMTLKRRWDHKTYSVEDFISVALSGNDYERGALETVVTETSNVLAAFARLVSVLADKGVLTRKEVFWVGENYIPDGDEG
jgi:hypothetical protein